MRLAIHSISWGEDVDLNRLLSDVTAAGYSGIELFQHPDVLGSPQRVFKAFQDYGLHLLGLSGGALEERTAFIREYAELLGRPVSHTDVPYVYFDDKMDDTVEEMLNQGFRIALHPHMYKPVQTLDEAERLLRKYRELRFLPDTAHLTIAGDDPVKSIERWVPRIDAVHMKDWQENVGRSYQFYARGFCELGTGDIDLERVLDVLIRKAFRIWLVVEQDWTMQPLDSAKRSHDWLTNRLGRAAL